VGYSLDMKKVGILGGGQLGRMTAIAAFKLGILPIVFTDSKNSVAGQVAAQTIVADYSDKSALLKFASQVDVATIEFENIPTDTLEFLAQHCKVAPCAKAVKIAQDRILEKRFLNNICIKTAEFKEINNFDQVFDIKIPFIIKTSRFGYDGKGQVLVRQKSDLQNLKNFPFPAVAEKVVDFKKEISIIVIVGKDDICTFPVAENVHQSGILHTSKVTANINDKTAEDVQKIGIKIAQELGIKGLLAVEFFLDQDNELIVNEIAPRPHNSGHWSMDCCDIDQFCALLLAILDEPIKKPNLLFNCKMLNLIGNDINNWRKYLTQSHCTTYIYGKDKIKEGRKMGHVNFFID
jgi:5-(carboxyamino)imidazole ribonucleotide synthase